MNTRTQYLAARRAYRATLRLSLLHDGALHARQAARDALTAVTNHWDDCRPAPMLWQQSWRYRDGVYTLAVYRACTLWCRTH
jgi:hypothetical protein